MNYSRYDLQTHPIHPQNLEAPSNPEEIPSLEYPSREEPGKFYAQEAEAKTSATGETDDDEELEQARASQSGVESARQSDADMDFEDDEVEEDSTKDSEEDTSLAANSGLGLRH